MCVLHNICSSLSGLNVGHICWSPRLRDVGHKRAENDDSPRIIEETRQYIRDFDRIVDATTTARELYDRMLEICPDRVNPGAL
jgi:hypothetical protein